MWGEDSMTEPARRRAKSLALHGRPVWLYRFAYVPEALRPTLPGAGHDAEIQMVFGNPSPSAKAGWSAADAAMAKTVSGYWVAFAKSGDPNHPGALPWPRFTSRQDRLMSFGGAGPAVLADFGRKRLDMLEAVETRPAH
jgi:para-nitrobenzyl esterase